MPKASSTARSQCRGDRRRRQCRPTARWRRVSDGVADHVLEGLVGSDDDGGRQGHCRVRLAGAAEASSSTSSVNRSSSSCGRRLVEHGEASGDIGLEWKLMQQPAESVDGLHLQSARCFQCRRANSRRARARCGRAAGLAGGSFDLGVERGVGAACSSPPTCRTRAFAILAAAALVKVMQRILAGPTPRSSRLMTRCASTCVLPEPALAETKAEVSGSAASICTLMTSGGNGAGAFTSRALIAAAGSDHSLDPREVIVVSVVVAPHWMHQRHIGVSAFSNFAASSFSRASCVVGLRVGRAFLESFSFGIAGRSRRLSASRR